MKMIFFGTRGLGAKVLEHLLRNGYSPTLVVTGPDKPAGRKQELTPSPVKKVAQEHNLSLTQPERPAELLSRSELKEAEFIVLAAYGNILPKELVGLPPKGALNVHPSLLPLYRGPSPERSALLNGDEKTGVTVIVMDEKVDHGPILAQEEFVIPEDMRHEELHAKLGEIGGELLVKTLPLWLEGKIEPKEQDHTKATYTKKLTREDGRIDWKKPAEYIERQVRALNPWPGTFTTFEGKRLKILKAHIEQGTLIIDELQLEGKKPTTYREFLLGHKDFTLP
ncbi:MAG: methionyl-tRNA formyltransferase [Parcubacteria group bacterium Greene0714_21]|nr:MAG: methionyl-tRNA formyltransferase [Parcubacteria group bacterium Greene0416_39]TSC97768.1 MAG: methionyl-tRNA formyltransferase [Parcubacteria group bacterium Greene1014_47]TSD04242.1 MAG: methionyl-tRNA formyltransferase [Parcubacteria group bacterium Greene0714_21]